jgi:hypothetical protein
MKGIDPRTSHALSLPPIEWQAWLERQRKHRRFDVLQTIRGELEAMSQRAVLLAEYIDQSSYHDHDAAVKEANKKLVRVRKAMGYAYPSRGPFTF